LSGDDDDDEVGKMIDKWTPQGGFSGEITFGALVGFSSGYALKKIGKAAAFIIGVGFIAAQVGGWQLSSPPSPTYHYQY